MKTIYLVRHGESTENIRSSPVFEGARAELTDTGREQAAQIARRAAKLPVEVVISSGYKRARDTAAAISETTGLPVEISDLFVEREAPSSCNGGRWGDEAFEKIFRAWERSTVGGEKVEDGENFADLVDRARRALSYLAERPENDILVVSHGFFSRVLVGLVVLQDTFDAADLQRMTHTLITKNTGITVFRNGNEDPRKEGSSWHMLTWNDHAHLG